MEYALVGIVAVLVGALLWVVYDARAAAAEAHAHTQVVTAQAARERNALIRAVLAENGLEYARMGQAEAQADSIAADADAFLRRRVSDRDRDPELYDDDGNPMIPVGMGG